MSCSSTLPVPTAPSASDVPTVPDAPEDYPWTGQSVRSALLLSTGIAELDPDSGVEAPTEQQGHPLVDVAAIEAGLAADGAAPLAERTLVVAVGSNQTPETIARKYARSGRDLHPATPFLRCTIHHLAVGHCAHISARGYIPAAPYRAEGERMELVATWFDDEQLAVVDETEPNYERIRLEQESFPVTLATGERPQHIDVYASVWGVLAHEQPIPLRHLQQEIFDELVALTGAALVRGDAAEICARLEAAPDALQNLAREHSLVAEDGLPRG
ncbi:hypothetical protein BH708_13295 [Brachybacterium sp. P6-10-X1]|uniref:hypothetical protein n=1 Tax=Brachybacterium sp. P6-10-X1 TaxID=1903186 RepID=UPI000971ABAE|nr:hypothetical protein [Brachybacterium sp. P6-10-X1]APX33526.1 hypothetical protein BH708_13295 [Brachybacterium sp. P6-10-X1]